MRQFEEFKEDLLNISKGAELIEKEISTALTLDNLIDTVKNFKTDFAKNALFNKDFYEKYEDEFKSKDVFFNESVSNGLVFVKDETLEYIKGDATAVISGNSFVMKVSGNPQIFLMDNSKIFEATDSTTIRLMQDESSVYSVSGGVRIMLMMHNSCIYDMKDRECVVETMDDNSSIHKITGSYIREMIGNSSVKVADMNTVIDRCSDGVSIEILKGDTIVNLMEGNSKVENLLGRAVIAEVRGSVIICKAFGNSVIENISGNCKVEHLLSSATIKNVRGNSQVLGVHEDASVEHLWDMGYVLSDKDINCTICDESVLRIKRL